MALAHAGASERQEEAAAEVPVTTLLPHPPQLGRYRLISPIGSGGMAAVYAAHPIDERDRLVAVKLMLPHLARDQRFAAMFLDEARIACQVSSPQVVRSYDYGSEQGSLYLVMEFVRGVSLRDLLLSASDANETLPLPVVAAIVLDAAEGLSDAHSTRAPDGTPLGVVHRDVSPHNILLGDDGRARMSDFGVAYAVDRLSRTTTGGVKGKPGYVSPEHFDHERVDQRADVFCLGVVAWECFAGRTLFRAAHPLAQLRQVLSAEIPLVNRERSEVGDAVAAVLARAMERSLEARTANMRVFVRELREAAEASFGVATPAEVKETLERLCAMELRSLDRAIALGRSRLRFAGTRFSRRDLQRAAPWLGGALAAAALVTALWPEAPVASTRHALAAPQPAAATEAAMLPEPSAPDPVAAEDAAVSAPHAPAPRKSEPRVATVVRKPAKKSKVVHKAKARPVARPAAPKPSSPLLDVGAFERGRKR